VAVWFALASMAIAGLGAGALTLTRLNGSATRLQDLADGAALAAVVQAQAPAAGDDVVQDAARRFDGGARTKATAEFDKAAMEVRILSRTPPEVSVSLTQDVHTIMAALVGREAITIRRQATAVAGEERRICLQVLDPSAASALKVHGSGDLSAPDCTVQVNSSADDSLHSWGSSTVRADATFASGPGASRLRNWSGAPSFGQPVRADPLAGTVVWPRPTDACIRLGPAESVLRPGRYCDGLTLTGDTRLQPGLYVIQRGGFAVRRDVVAEGVTVVLLDPEGEFDMGGPGRLKLTAPTEGPWAGIALAAKPGAGMPTSRLGGNTQTELSGTIYLPGHRLELWGSPDVGGTAPNRAVIVRQLELHGSATLSLAGGYPSGVYKTARLKD
jgi:hypothetical protein